MRNLAASAMCSTTSASRSLILALLLAAPAQLHAQGERATDVMDSTSTAWPVAAWLSGGLGRSSVDGVAGVAAGTISVGPVLAMYRNTDVQTLFFGRTQRTDQGVLVGLRTRDRRLFLAGALGYMRATGVEPICSNGCRTPSSAPDKAALGYDFSAHANFIIPGIAVSIAGVIGPSDVSYSTFTVSLELGYFGQ